MVLWLPEQGGGLFPLPDFNIPPFLPSQEKGQKGVFGSLWLGCVLSRMSLIRLGEIAADDVPRVFVCVSFCVVPALKEIAIP